ncbi:MAG: hypothetical protein IPK63_06010 [Candidatus Competibacteraceae bacterium]|nr:hypothetical protein [Candidatus Competibacteraceae bacterium]
MDANDGPAPAAPVPRQSNRLKPESVAPRQFGAALLGGQQLVDSIA